MVANILHSSATPEWYTPREIVDAARDVLGFIELDPASCVEANLTVRAEQIYTAADDGLRQDWQAASVWLNPPYGKEAGKSLQGLWSHHLGNEYRARRVGAACLLVNAMTGNKWFAPLWAYPLCFLSSRVHFVAPAGSGLKDQPTHSSVVAYMGPQPETFAERFALLGHVVMPSQVLAVSRQTRLL